MVLFSKILSNKLTPNSVFLSSLFLSSLLLTTSQPVSAIELIDAVIPAKLKNSYKMRQLQPLSCIKTTTTFIEEVKLISAATNSTPPPVTLADAFDTEQQSSTSRKASPNNASTQLLATCYFELEDYEHSLALLMPLLKTPSVTSDEIRTLTLIANNIPESERPQLSNELLINMLNNSLSIIQESKNFDSKNLINTLNLGIVKLALESNQYQLANTALTRARENIKEIKDPELNAWLAYYYAHYYDQINQHQLAITYFQAANSIADRLALTKLSSLVKGSLSALYQQKHRYKQAIHFATQRVDLLLHSENYVQQADGLLKLAVLKRQNKEYNQALIYLFNALDLVEKKNRTLVANIYLELGRSYSSFPDELEKNTRFAQKYLQNARRQFQRLNKLEQETESILLLAQLNIRNKETGLAILQLEEVLILAKNKFPELRVAAFEMLALGYELSGDHQKANFYFKSFHSLQNTIKEKIFTLQQLKIDEQFQLIEQTQQKIQLETANNQLLLKNNLFQDVAYWAITFFLFALLAIFFILFRYKKLIKRERITRKKMQFHPRSLLPLHQAQIKNNDLEYQGHPLFYALVHIPFLDDLNESKGLFRAEKLEKTLGETLIQFFSPNTRVTQVRDNQLLFISEQEHHGDAQQFAQHIAEFFQTFAETHGLNREISSGVVAFPFLNNVSRAISPERMLNLTSLALFGACQLRKKANESSWLELYAIEKIQPAFFDGDLWLLGQAGIRNGIVKLKSSHSGIPIKWPELNK